MDRTDAPRIVELQASLDRAREAESRAQRLREIGERMLEAGTDLDLLARVALDGCLDHLDFERGVLLVPRGAAGPEDSEEPGGEGLPLEVMAARAREREGRFQDFAKAEFAINRAAVKQALKSPGPLAIPDSLLDPRPGGPEVHRSVLCQSFTATSQGPGVIYLDRALGSEPVREVDLSALAAFAERCLPVLSRGFLLAEVLRLRSLLEEARESGAEPAREEEKQENATPSPGDVPVFHGLVGASEKMRRIFKIIEKIKDSDLSVCISGESGTGKELVARAIHATSARRDRKFVCENCGTIAETLLESELFGYVRGAFTGADQDRPGLFQVASGGTLFLDEIGDMSEGMQRKLLRVLQEGVVRPLGSKETMKVDTRVICASNRNLQSLVKSGAFRVDLFYRLNVISIEIPPLRERMEDLPSLVGYFLGQLEAEEGKAPRVSESAMNAFRDYSWPGNVRELRNVIRRAAVTCTRHAIARKDVVPLLTGDSSVGFHGEGLHRSEAQLILHIPRRDSFNEIISECERVVLLNALKECRWNKSRVVKALKIPRQSLYNMIDKHGLRRKWES